MKKSSIFYKNPALWLVVTVPVLAVVVGIFLLIVSIYSFDGLVVDDYYKKGKQINITLERDRVAWEQDLFADIYLHESSSQVLINLSAAAGFQFPDKIHLQFIHRTMSGKDRQIELQHQSAGTYKGQLSDLSASRWLVELGTSQWRLTGSFVWPVESNFELENQRIAE